MAAYNAEETIGEAIQSVLSQDWQDWELLIIDDGSEDGTGFVIQSFQDSRINYFESKFI